MKYSILCFLLLFFLPLKANKHKYYVSITEIYYNRQTSTLDVNIKLFYDDLQQAIEIEQGVRITDPIAEYEDEIDEYIQQHFKIGSANNPVNLQLRHITPEIDAIWIEYQSETIPFSLDWQITNTIFLELFDTQNNIINFFPNKQKQRRVKGLALNRQKKSGEIVFKSVN